MSMNWLGFSLSSHQELTSQPNNEDHSQTVEPRGHGFNFEGISTTHDASGECFNLPSDSTTHSLNNLPSSFGIFEALNTNTNTHHTPQDWNSSKDNYNSTQSFLFGTSCNNNNQNLNNNNNQHQQPKLENFLGQHSFGEHDHTTSYTGGNSISSSRDNFMFQNCSLQLPVEKSASGGGGSPKNGSSIGLSMIKTWLRNQKPPHSEAPVVAENNISLSMNSVSQSSSSVALPLLTSNNVDGESSSSENNKHQSSTTVDAQVGAVVVAENNVPRKSIDTFGQRTSIYRGVTRHRWTGRYEAHLWDNSCRREGQTRKGRQVYLGGYDKEEKAARAYDLAALKYWGTTTTTNFPISNYEKELEEMKNMTRQEYIASLRRKSSGFSRGASIYRGVTRHHQHGRWQARIGRVAGNKDLYLGTFSTQEEAAEAYDVAAIKFRGLNAVTNFDMSRYDVKSILESSTLPIGGAAKRLKEVEEQQQQLDVTIQRSGEEPLDNYNSINSYATTTTTHHHGCYPSLSFQQLPQPYNTQFHNYPYGHQKIWCKQEQDQTFQDIHQLQQHNTHNFFQQGIMSIDSNTSIDDGFGMNIPMGTNSTFIGNDGNNQIQRSNGFGDNEVKGLGYENVFGSSYYYSQQTPAGAYDGCNSWVPTAIPTIAQARTSNMGICPGGVPPFSLLHE